MQALENSTGMFLKTTNRLVVCSSLHSSILLQSIYTKCKNSFFQNETCSTTFSSTGYINQRLKWSKVSIRDEWVQKACSIRAMKYYVQKYNTVLPVAAEWWTWRMSFWVKYLRHGKNTAFLPLDVEVKI